MKNGVLIYWNNAKFYGFVREDNSDAEYFSHGTNFLYQFPKEGDLVSFSTELNRKKEGYQEQAVQIKKL